MTRDVFLILNPGVMTTVQDRGRFGYRKYGIPVSGALDTFSFMASNRLVGNDDDTPVLELTFKGPEFEVLADCVIALAGAQMTLRVNGDDKPLWTSVQLAKGDVVRVGQAVRGLRGYLAVGGGICVDSVMGSASTFVPANIGGYKGRGLVAGDILQAHESDRSFRPVMIRPEYRPGLESRITVRAVPGPQEDFFESDGDALFSTEYICGPKSDRMGIRLQGPKMEFRDANRMTIISEPTLKGCVQTPPDGQPIILLVEQTMGGYAKIATVINPDLDLLAQLKPGDAVRFEKITIENALRAHRLHKASVQAINPSFV